MLETTKFLKSQPLPEEFERIYREHCVLVYRTAYAITGKVEDAEDVLQSLFLHLFQTDFPPDFHRNPKAYLYRSAVNITLNLIRSRQRVVLTNNPESFEDRRPNHSSRDFEMWENLRTALAKLKPKAAETFILRYVHGYSIAEIATLLRTSRGTIAVNLFRSRVSLKQSIRAYWGEKS